MIERVGNRGDLDALDDLVSDELAEHAATPPSPGGGREALRAVFAEARSGMPDLHIEVVEALQDGDRVAALLRWTGTHEGEFMGLPPTGRPVAFSSMEILRFDHGRAAEHWSVSDHYKLTPQLGFPPARNERATRPATKAVLAFRARRLGLGRSPGRRGLLPKPLHARSSLRRKKARSA